MLKVFGLAFDICDTKSLVVRNRNYGYRVGLSNYNLVCYFHRS